MKEQTPPIQSLKLCHKVINLSTSDKGGVVNTVKCCLIGGYGSYQRVMIPPFFLSPNTIILLENSDYDTREKTNLQKKAGR